MTELSDIIDLDLLASKLAERLCPQPRWLKANKAAIYSGMNTKRLKRLAEKGEISGYSDNATDRGHWIFDRESIDKYRLKPILERDLKHKQILDRIDKSL